QHTARLRGDDPRARDLPRVRGDLEGADDAAHAADVGHERDPRHRDRGRDDRRRRRPCGRAAASDRVRRDGARVRQRRRRLRRHRPDARDVQEARAGAEAGRLMGATGVNLLYLVTIVCFVLALRFLSSPATARRGNQIGAVGMAIAIVATLLKASVHITWLMVLGAVIGGAFGAVAARLVKMTAMPQMVALFNGVGGGAAALIALAEF